MPFCFDNSILEISKVGFGWGGSELLSPESRVMRSSVFHFKCFFHFEDFLERLEKSTFWEIFSEKSSTHNGKIVLEV